MFKKEKEHDDYRTVLWARILCEPFFHTRPPLSRRRIAVDSCGGRGAYALYCSSTTSSLGFTNSRRLAAQKAARECGLSLSSFLKSAAALRDDAKTLLLPFCSWRWLR